MKIAHFDIQNFRKLKNCRVELADDCTIFVGANNSGKTSAMDALIAFLKKSKRKELTTRDISLINWPNINKIGEQWVEGDGKQPNLSLTPWRQLFPTLDVWLEVDESQIHYISHILPTLDWDGGLLGVRLILEPKDPESLYKAYLQAYKSAEETIKAHDLNDSGASLNLTLWPRDMHDFLDRKINEYFTVNFYVLNPELINEKEPQQFTEWMEPLEGDPFEGLFKIDIINAQRGFSDPNTDGAGHNNRRLSTQLRDYFDKHLDPAELPEVSDLEALEAMERARVVFDEKLKTSFSKAITELEQLNYPGFNDPQIVLSSRVNPLEGLNHESAVQFRVGGTKDYVGQELCLPEKYNGLGYQNLISMVFNLIRFRDEWMRVGKAAKRQSNSTSPIEVLHLVLIEEPEAHLHAQVQQVFIKKAFAVLRNHPDLLSNKQFTTQMVISTHSSHIAHESDFTGLRYFRRESFHKEKGMPSSFVVNMSTTFGEKRRRNDKDLSESMRNEEVATAKFAKRYLKTTHSDLFFADGVILVEGAAEKMLVPHFIREHYPDLDKSYISILEIGGSHAYRLKPLIETLGIPTLVITDLDSAGKSSKVKTLPKRKEGQITGNNTLKNWVPKIDNIDDLLALEEVDKIDNKKVRVAFPSATKVQYKPEPGGIDGGPLYEEAIPYTFEDALVLANLKLFREMINTTGLIKKMVEAVRKSSLDEACADMFEALSKSSKKAEMALELLFSVEPKSLVPPHYIENGLEWLQEKVSNNQLLG